MLGCDFVGECVELGSSVKRYKKGDIIAGLIWGGKLAITRLMARDVAILIYSRRDTGPGCLQSVHLGR